MTWITTTAVSNALVAAILGWIAYVVSRRAKNPSVGHALWILVLVKLITPPLFHVPLAILPPVQEPIASHSNALLAQPAKAVAPTRADAVPIVAESVSESESTVTHALPVTAVWLVRIWIGGALLYGLYQLYVTLQMCRLMRMAVPDCRLDRAMHRVAKQAKVKNYPTARVVPWVGSPMLWGLGSTSVIVLPEQLFDNMEDAAADTLLQHELAHFQRGDQWIRILEVAASTLFWWHPLVWYAIRAIEVHEEQCCDAWVVQQNPTNRRRYAEALLDTVDFIADTTVSTRPLAASGLGRVPLLEQRIKSIMKGERSPVSPVARLSMVLLLVAILLQPHLLHASFVRESITPSSAEEPFPEFVRGIKQHHEQTIQDKLQARAAIPEVEYAIADSVYGTYQLIATSGYRVRLNEVVTGKSIDLADYEIRCAAFAPPADQTPEFAAGCLDGSIYLFDCLSGEQKKKLAQFEGVIQSLVYSPNGNLLAAGGDDGFVHLFNLVTGESQSFDETFGPVQSIRFSASGEKLAVVTNTTLRASSYGHVSVWDVRSARLEQEIVCPTAVGVAGFNAQGNVLTGEWNGMLRTWSANGRLLLARQKPKGVISAAAFSANAMTLENLSELESVVSE